eukprot:m.175729 g.175729  ORF g.175729 m.175729 type:complete len:141 (-) comp16790_c0_seq1:74-496(-)
MSDTRIAFEEKPDLGEYISTSSLSPPGSRRESRLSITSVDTEGNDSSDDESDEAITQGLKEESDLHPNCCQRLIATLVFGDFFRQLLIVPMSESKLQRRVVDFWIDTAIVAGFFAAVSVVRYLEAAPCDDGHWRELYLFR